MKTLQVMSALCYVISSVLGTAVPDLTNASVLVIGGAGFIGSKLIAAIHKSGCKEVKAVDSFDAYSSIHLKRLRAAHVKQETGVVVMEDDACSPTFNFSCSLQTFTHIFHFGGISGKKEPGCMDKILEKIKNVTSSGNPPPKLFYSSPLVGADNLTTSTASEMAVNAYFNRYNGTIAIACFLIPSVYGPMDRPESPVGRLARVALTAGEEGAQVLMDFKEDSIGPINDASYMYVDSVVS